MNAEMTSLIDGVRLSWSQWNLVVDLTGFHGTAHGAAAELTVRTGFNGHERTLTQGMLNLSSFTARQQLVRRLGELHDGDDDGPEWNTVIENACVQGLRAYRKGTPSESLEPLDDDQPAYFVCNPLIYARHATLIYGPGESGKSLFALFVGCLLSSGGQSASLAVRPDGHHVLYLDWELRAPEMRARVKQLRAGHPELTKSPWHRSLHLPLSACIEEIRREVREKAIDIVIVDSLGPATGGEIERASDPVAFFNALNSLECSSLLIGHVAKPADEEKIRTPYGSVYYYNLSRSIFEIRLVAEPDSDERVMMLNHRKNNLGRRLQPLGYRLTVTDEFARFEPCDPDAEPALQATLPLASRIRNLLEDGRARTAKQIADELGAKHSSVKTTLSNFAGRKWMMLGGQGQETTWTVLNPRNETP
jgi:hypothetical protein